MSKYTYSHESDWKLRNLNRVAEPKCEQYIKRRMLPYVRYGLDALDANVPMFKIPKIIRSAPDFIVFNEDDKPYFFEAKAFKKTVKLKIEDLKCYREWNRQMPLKFFFYYVGEGTYCEATFEDIVNIVKNHKPEIKSYPERADNKYYELYTSWLPNFVNF